jgi:hypothetical protein
MKAAERDVLRRDLLALAGYTVYHYDKVKYGYYILMTPGFDPYVFQDLRRFASEIEEYGYLAAQRETEAEAWQDAPEMTVDWLLSLLSDDASVAINFDAYAATESSYEAIIEVRPKWRGNPAPTFSVYAATRLDALALAVRDYLKAARDE